VKTLQPTVCLDEEYAVGVVADASGQVQVRDQGEHVLNLKWHSYEVCCIWVVNVQFGSAF
jgi:hypothetical protein